MERLFRVSRRRPHIIDMTIFHSSDPDVTGYRVRASTNFDVAFTDIFDTNKIGFLDSNVNRNVIDTQPINGVRAVFDPDTYNGAAGISDGSSFWLQVVPLIGTTPQTPGAPTLVLPDFYHYGVLNVVIAGQAPTTELQLDLPTLMEDFRFVNEDTANTLRVGFEEGGPKHAVLPESENFMSASGNAASLYIQADTAAIDFTMVTTLAFPR